MDIAISCDHGRFGGIREAADSEKRIDWWDDGNPDIYACIRCYAAVEIGNHLEKAGCVVSYNAGKGDFHARIFVGESPDSSKPGTDGSFSCRIVNGEYLIYIWSGNYKGILHASYEWLESLGFRWFLPDEKGSIIPDSLHFDEARKDICYDYRTRGCYDEFIDDTNRGFLLWASRNRMNLLRVKRFTDPHYVKKLGFDIMGGGHEIFYRYLNPNTKKENTGTYFELHPEWFALIDGKRSRRDENLRADEGYYTGDNICTSDEGAVSELAENMIASFTDGDYRHLDYLNLWAYDNGRWCQCDECREIGNLSRRMLMLAYEINGRFRDAYEKGEVKRRIKLVVPVYHETLEPPDRPLPDDFDYEHIIATFFPIERCFLHNIDDVVCSESNSLLIKDYRGWSREKGSNYRGELFIGEYYNVSSFASLPFLFTGTMSNDIPFYHRTGTRHLYYMHISARRWGMLALNNNLLASLMRNIRTDAGAFRQEYHSLMYPETHGKMMRFHETLEEASANAKYLKHYQFAADKSKPSLMSQIDGGDIFPLEHCKFDYRTQSPQAGPSFEETMDLFKKAGEIIDGTLHEAGGMELLRIEEEKMRFDYGYLVMKFIYWYVCLRMAYAKGNEGAAKKAFAETEILRGILTRIKEPIAEFVYESSKYGNAYLATWHSDGYEKFRKMVTENHKWNSK